MTPCNFALGVYHSHFRAQYMGCNPRTEDPCAPCPVHEQIMMTELERRATFEQGMRDSCKGYYLEAKTFEITSTGRLLIDGEETSSQYLTRADGAAIHPTCHCVILYSDNKEAGGCPSDCPCFHKSPIIAFVLILPDGTIERVPANDEAALAIAREKHRQLTTAGW